MNIGIIGLGIVGKAVKFGFEKKQGHTIFVYDIALPETSIEEVFKNAEVIFVCVSTPQAADGSCDVSQIDDVCKKLNILAKKKKMKKDVVIKSTMDPQFVSELEKKYTSLRLAINPEFLKQQAAIHDFCHQDICVIGTNYDDLYEKIVAVHGNLADEYIHTTPINASLVKYFCNTFHATRIIFANLFYELAQNLNADYTEIKSIAVKRHDIIDYYLDCNINLRGFGGACLPKDTAAIVALSKKLNLQYDILQSVIKDNTRINKENPTM